MAEHIRQSASSRTENVRNKVDPVWSDINNISNNSVNESVMGRCNVINPQPVNSCNFPSNQVGERTNVDAPSAMRQVNPSSQLGPHDSGQTTIQSLRSQEELRRQATLQLQQLQQLSALTQDTGDSNFLFCKSVMSGRDRMGGDDYKRTYVRRP